MRRKTSPWQKATSNGQRLTLASFLVGGALVASGGASLGAPAPIRLLPQAVGQIHSEGMPVKQQALLARMPANFHHFGVAAVGKPLEAETLTLQFNTDATVTRISSTPDFMLMGGGTCKTGHHYAGTCSLRVEFTPQGAGTRSGKLTVSTSDGRAVTLGLIGYSSVPVVSFTPSEITTLPATISSGTGLISGSRYLAVDDGDSLYIADTGNKAIRYIDSSLSMTTIASPGVPPAGVTIDMFGQVYFSVPSTNTIYEIYDYGPVVQASGSGSDACGVGAGCVLSSESLGTPGEMSTSDGNSIFFTDTHQGAALSIVQPIPATLIQLYNPFTYQTTPSGAFAADGNATLYSSWTTGSVCEIVAQSLYNAENSNVAFNKVAGGRTCGFAGDGGRATGAEMGAKVGQIAFDLAGNMYFTDTANNRVRRVDANTGIIRTIAGNGKVGRRGDGGPASAAALGAPTGLAVDSQGQVYVLTPSDSTSTGPAQDVRELTATGMLKFADRTHATSSAPLIVTVSNTGTSTLVFNSATISGGNHLDFAIDSGTTNCNFKAGNTLYVGQSCQIGVVFTPGAIGARSSTLKLVDNTVNAASKVLLSGKGL